MILDISFIRHMRTRSNLERRYISFTDEDIDGSGERINYINPDMIFSSPMARCVSSAKVFFPDKTPTIIMDLSERNFGVFEGKTYDELKNDKDYIRFIEGAGKCDIPKGESYDKFKARCMKAFTDILNNMAHYQVKSSAVITHGGVIMTILCPEGDDIYDYMAQNAHGYTANYDTDNKLLKVTGTI